VRAHRPVQHRHQLRRGGEVQASGITRGEQIRGLVNDHRCAEAIVLVGHDVVADEPIEHREGRGRILGQLAEVANLAVGQRDHLLEPLVVAPAERAQSAAEIVVEHQRPAAEQLLGQELHEHAVARSAVAGDAKQIVGVAMQDERGGGTREIQIGELRRPSRKPVGQLFHGATAGGLRRHW
jgi:hypothetical protein